MGTRFIASEESMAVPEYKRMLVESTLDDLPARGAIDVANDISVEARERPHAKKWKDIWSAGHSVSGVRGVAPAAAIIAELREEYEAARLENSRIRNNCPPHPR